MSLEETIAINDGNPEPRCACVLLLDTSGSMSGERVEELNQGLIEFKKGIMADPLAPLRIELAVITFDSQVNVVRDFAPVAQFEPPVLTAQYQTFTGTALCTALARLEERKEFYKKEGLPYFRPWLFLITDGVPEGEPAEQLQEAKQRLALAQANKHVKVFAVGVGDSVDLQKISEITGTTALRLRGTNFSKMFSWMSSSLKAVSASKVGTQVKLPPLDDWAST